MNFRTSTKNDMFQEKDFDDFSDCTVEDSTTSQSEVQSDFEAAISEKDPEKKVEEESRADTPKIS